MVDFKSLSDDELRSLTAEWYLKHRQALDIWQLLRAEQTRRLVEESDQLFFTDFGPVPKHSD